MVGQSVHLEITSGVSALVIVGCGMHMLVFWRTDSQTLLLISSLFLVNGIASVVSHLTLLPMWAVADRWSMLIVAWIACGFVIDELIALASDLSRVRVHRLRAVGWVVASFCVVASLSYDAVEHDPVVVDVLIAAPLVVSVSLGVVMSCVDRTPHSRGMATRQQWRVARCRFGVGCLLIILGVLSDMASSYLCRDMPWFPFHATWHVLMAFGLVQTLVFAAILHLDRQRHAGLWIKEKGYFRLLPRIDFYPIMASPRATHLALGQVGIV